MYLNTKQFQDLDEDTLYQFVATKVPEDLYLDYKIDISLIEKRKSYKDFLKM